jgi:ketosteroid isomerase-like protein
MDQQLARVHAERWIAAWNARDLDAIMEQYAPMVRFSALTVISRWNKTDGVLVGREELRRHFEQGLARAPHLYFELIDVLMGVDGMTIIYRRETGTLVADVVVLDENYRGVEVRVYYGITPP